MKGKLNSILLGLVILFIAGSVVGLVGKYILKTPDKSGVYYGVYLRSGDVYFGTLGQGPNLTLNNVYALLRVNDKKQPFQLAKLTDMFWGPAGALEINEKQILWTAELAPDGNVMKYIKASPAGK